MSLWTTERRGAVVLATYLNPPMNYFCAEGAGELAQLIESWRDPAIRAVVLTGGLPGRFITHYSVEELHALAADREALRRAGTTLTDGYHALLLALRDLPKPVIVAMNGDAMGGGFELCLACDIRVAARGDHRFGLPEIKLGILPGGSGTQRLARLLGAGRAIEFILRGRIVAPDTALQLGLVHELADDALAHALRIAEETAQLPPLAAALIKRSVYQGAEVHLAGGLKIESQAFAEAMASDDGLRAMAAYLEQPLDKRRDWLEAPPASDYNGH